MPHPDRERLTLVALGEQPVVDALSAHLDQCAQCRSEVTAMRDTVALAREAGPAPLEAPPDHVWSSIAAELALEADPPPGPVRPARPSRRRRGLVVGALAAAAALVAAVAIAVAGAFTGDPPATRRSRRPPCPRSRPDRPVPPGRSASSRPAASGASR